MDMSQQEVDDDNSSAAAEQRDAIHRFHRQNAPSRQKRRFTRGASRKIDLGVPQIDISLDADALHFECEQGASHEQRVTLRNTGSASMCNVPCRLAHATARHPQIPGAGTADSPWRLALWRSGHAAQSPMSPVRG